MEVHTTESVTTGVAKNFFKSIANATIADKITVCSFIGTATTVIYSALTFLPNLEQRVVSLETELKTVEKVQIEATYLKNAVDKSEKLNGELQNMRNENSELKGKVDLLEKLVLTRK